MSARRRRLTPIGEAWHRGLHVDGMELPDAIVTSLVFYDTCPTKDTVADAFEQHMWPLFRCSSRVEDGHFVKVEAPMNRQYHVVEEIVEDESAIDDFAQKVMGQKLDAQHPLWKVTVLKTRKGRSAVIMRFHHVISDGLGLLFAFLPMMSCENGQVIDHIPLPAALLGKKMSRKQSVAKKNALLRLVDAVLDGMFAAVNFFRGILGLLIMRMDSPICINAPVAERKPFLRFSGRHTFTRMPSVPMDLVQAVRAKHACTVNDVLMCGLAGAIRRYSAKDLEDPMMQRKGLECKCTMLLGLPRPGNAQSADESMRNNILTPIVRLPVEEATAADRLKKTMAIIGDLKSLAYVTGIRMTTRLLTAIAPVKVSRQIASEAISKLTANVTSLPMATVPVKMFGQEIKEIQALFVNPIPQIAMISYNGMVHWNMISDPKLIPQPRVLGQHLLAELQELASASPDDMR